MHWPTFTPRKIPGTHFCQRLSQAQGHSAGGKIRSTKNSNDLIGNWTRNLPACSIVSQPTMLLHAPALFQQQTLNIVLHRFRHRNMLHNKIQSRKPPPGAMHQSWLLSMCQESGAFFMQILHFTSTHIYNHWNFEQISALLGIDSLHYKLLHAFLT
jgi:hypothetical protein